jgi:hypothetical protein
MSPPAQRPPTPVAYVMGHGYSGSTLLTLLLGVHPEIATVGEVGIAPSSRRQALAGEANDAFLCSCLRPIAECPFWQQVERGMAARGEAFDPLDDRLHPGIDADAVTRRLLQAGLRGPLFELGRRAATAGWPPARRERDRFLRRYRRFVATVIEAQRGRLFLDASKTPERAVLLRRLRDLDLHVVHLLRDGRAVAASTMRHRGLSAAEAATSWERDLRRCERARGRFAPQRWLTVRYEDLCTAPDATLQSLYRFLGLRPVARTDYRAVEQHILGNRMRLQRGSEIRLDERWREGLSPGDRQRIEAILGAANERYGYAA